MDGMQFCRLLKADLEISHIPVIMLTARAEMENKLEGLEIGADDYIAKPFDAQELRLRIKNVLNQRERLRKHFSRELSFDLQGETITSVDEKFMRDLIHTIQNEMHRPEFNIDEIADYLHVSRPTLNRKIRALTSQSPAAFLKLLRLKKARHLIQTGFGNITEAAFEAGFNSLSHFTRSFVRQFGIRPSDELKSKNI